MSRASTCISHSLIVPIIIIGNKPNTWWCLFHITLWSVPHCPPFPTPITSPRCPSRIPLYRALIQMHKPTNTGSEISGMVGISWMNPHTPTSWLFIGRQDQFASLISHLLPPQPQARQDNADLQDPRDQHHPGKSLLPNVATRYFYWCYW
jgi:hypothetical protein